jgi:hypothetical protein
MNPKPVGRIASNRAFEFAIHIGHDRFHAAGLAAVAQWNFIADLHAPSARGDAITDQRE